ncbi:hypothetical protein RHS01_10544 [Rhizoctonia solani]|uniref:Uncharacterized protein n=1 Tax=Rhizoctonia solani TaxID=456999 RepID=A0A8H7I1T6_9AGAM|nr:hypothetical protein RHS01_10544 [Rhizoctonia solani]
MEPEPSPAALLKAITALTATVRSLQDQIRAQSQQITKLRAICKETADLLGDKDQGAPKPSLAHQLGLSPLLPTQEGKSTLQARLGLDSRPRFAPPEERVMTQKMKNPSKPQRKSLAERLGV